MNPATEFHRAAILLGMSLVLSNTAAAEWPQFRGPRASGVDGSKPLPIAWDVPSGRNVLWQRPVPGLAHSSPIVVGDRVYVTTAVSPGNPEVKVGLYGDIEPVEDTPAHQWRLLAIGRASGDVVWDVLGLQAVPSVKRHPKSTHCNSTPASDGTNIVALFGSEGLFCFDRAGKLVWRKSLGVLDSGYYQVPSAQWGFGSSPVLFDGKVLVLCDVQNNSFLAAFDLADGRELWRTPRMDVPGWSTPTVVEASGRRQIVVNGWHYSGGYDFETGKVLWRLDGGGDIPVPTPIFANDLICLTSAHGGLRPMRAIRPDATGNITAPDPAGTNAAIAWVHPRQGNYMQTPIAVGNRLYGCTDSGVLTCFDARTGKIVFSERMGDGRQGFTASPVSDERHLYFAGETGRVLVVPVADTFSIVSTNNLGSICMASPAIAGGTLFFRTADKLVAIGSR
jgi:outer membrane protein assembly factor BamB